MFIMKKHVIIGMVIILAIVGVFSFKLGNSSNISVVKEKSYFSEFEIIGQEVRIKTVITLKNSSNEIKEVSVKGDFAKDMKIDLLETEILQGFDEDTYEEVFVVEQNSTKTYNIVFVGEWAGGKQKANRNLPQILIEDA